MSEKQTYNKCKYFSLHNLCPHRDIELMKQFIADTEIHPNIYANLDFSKELEINKLCSSCIKFKPH